MNFKYRMNNIKINIADYLVQLVISVVKKMLNSRKSIK